jgi:hypothetical protein
VSAFRVAALGVALGLAIAGGCRFDGAWRPRRLTGTCEGACDHYLSCKRSGDSAARTACVAECREVFQDTESLRAYESLECTDAVEYVEGDSGTGPGTVVVGDTATGPATSR